MSGLYNYTVVTNMVWPKALRFRTDSVSHYTEHHYEHFMVFVLEKEMELRLTNANYSSKCN